MIYKLSLKDYCRKVNSDEKDYTEQFYCYLIIDDDDNEVGKCWFSQKVDSKNIYSVSVSLSEKFDDNYHIYVHCDDVSYFPVYFKLEVDRRTYLNRDDIGEHKKCIEEVWDIGKTIMTIFLQEEHRKVKP